MKTGTKFADLPDLLTPLEAAVLLRLSKNATYEVLRRGDVPSIRLGRSIRIPKAELLRIIADSGRLGSAVNEVRTIKNAPGSDKPRALKGGRDGSASSAP